MTEAAFVPMQYTRVHDEELRRQRRDALEKFEPPATDLPATISTEGHLTYMLAFPAEASFKGLVELLSKGNQAIAAYDDAAYRLTLASGVTLEFWPTEDGATRLECSGIFIPDDDQATGGHFREILALIALLDRNSDVLQGYAKDAHRSAQEQALQRQFSAAQLADLAGATTALQAAGFNVTMPNASPERFTIHVSRPLGYTQSFSNLDAFLAFARHAEQLVAAPAQKPPQGAPGKGRRSAIVTPRRSSGGILTWLLLIAGLAVLAALFFYPWPG